MTFRISLRQILIGLLVLAALGMAVAWSGAVPISATSGHWRVTDWFLHWVMRNSVRTQAALTTPDMVRDDNGLVSAAGQYRQACQVCHGGPGVAPSPVMQRATPPAPDLARTGPEWSDRQLFWIIRHGVKMTGMPAWPAAGRDDEVARMVAFVRRLPTMTPAAYRALTDGVERPVAGVRAGVVASCTGCHGADGRGRGQRDIPVLGGQKPAYLLAALRDYATGARGSGPMQTAAAALTPAEMRALAAYFAGMPGLVDRLPARPHPIVARGLARRQLPACVTCHAPGKRHPILAGQRQAYLAARLRHWRGPDGVVDHRLPADTMATIARRIPEEEIDVIAASLAGR